MSHTSQNKSAVEPLEHAIQQVDESNTSQELTLLKSIRTFPKIVGYCIGLSSAILLYGYDLVIVGTVSAMPTFQYVYQFSGL